MLEPFRIYFYFFLETNLNFVCGGKLITICRINIFFLLNILKATLPIESIFVHGEDFEKHSLLNNLIYSQNVGRIDFYYF